MEAVSVLYPGGVPKKLEIYCDVIEDFPQKVYFFRKMFSVIL